MYFRTSRSKVNGETIIEQHIDSCPYGLDHSAVPTPRRIFDPTVGYLISDKHIQDALKRAFNQHIDPEYGKPKKSSGGKRKNKTPINIQNSEVEIRGKALIGKSDEDDVESTREPYLYQRFIYEITERDFDTSKLVKGIISDIMYNDNYITIRLHTTNGTQGRMYFSESFKVDNSQQFNQMKYYQNYLENQNNNGSEVFISCAGDVIKDNYGISIYVKSYKHVMIDGMDHYTLLKKMGVL
jgi:hypothetical protein